MSAHLDFLHLRYLSHIDTYQQQLLLLNSTLSSGFIALSAANHASPPPDGGHYGRDQYEFRTAITAARGVSIKEHVSAEDGVEFSIIPLDGDAASVQAEKAANKEEVEASGLRHRKPPAAATTVKEPEAPAPALQAPPATIFHPLPPPQLRTAASHFGGTLPMLATLASTLSALASISQQITHLRRASHVYKILIAPPTWPLELSPLDRSSGYIHLCTAPQALGVLSRFMAEVGEVWVLRVRYEGVAEKLRWEIVEGVEDGGEEFPHLFGDLNKGVVDAVGRVVRGDDGWGEKDWEAVEWEAVEKEV